MFAMVIAIMAFERSGVRIAGLGEVRDAIFSMGFGKGFEEFKVVGSVDDSLGVILKEVSHGFEGLASCIGPRLSAPPAAGFFEKEHGVISFDGAGAKRGFEAIRLQ